MIYDVEGILATPLQQRLRVTLRPRPETCERGEQLRTCNVQFAWLSNADIIHPWTVPHTWLETVLGAAGEIEPAGFPGIAKSVPF